MIRVHRLTPRPGHGMTVLIVPFWCRAFRWFNEQFAVATRGHEHAILDRAAYEEHFALFEVGAYGICTSCGQRIVSKRLKAFPEADLCIRCAQEAERG